ncbi:hypothetical protein GQX74_004435 [Glossina fuscipes]|nr:hypothetical protein GQX74_004435 [Glossina fuscipes]
MTKQDIKHVINDDSDKLVLVYLTSGGVVIMWPWLTSNSQSVALCVCPYNKQQTRLQIRAHADWFTVGRRRRRRRRRRYFVVFRCVSCLMLVMLTCKSKRCANLCRFISVVVMSLWHDRLFGGCIEWVFWFAANGQQYCHRPHCPFAGERQRERVGYVGEDSRNDLLQVASTSKQRDLKNIKTDYTKDTETLHLVELGFAVDLNGLCRITTGEFKK